MVLADSQYETTNWQLTAPDSPDPMLPVLPSRPINCIGGFPSECSLTHRVLLATGSGPVMAAANPPCEVKGALGYVYQWTDAGNPTKEGATAYSGFRCMEEATGKVRDFIIGDIVEVNTEQEEGTGMVAQVVELSQKKETPTFVADMLVKFRYLHHKKEIDANNLPNAMRIVDERDDQVFFWDWLEDPGRKSAEVIEKHVFLFRTD